MPLRVPLLLLLAIGCSLAPVLAGDPIKVANEGAIRDDWTLAPGTRLAAPGYPEAFVARGADVCMAMGYRINRDGTTSDFIVLRSWTSGTGEQEPETGFWNAFAQASAAALGQWRFKPVGEVVRPVDTVATLTFAGGATSDLRAVRAHCRVDDLQALLEKAKIDHARRGDLNRTQLENALRAQIRNEMKAVAAQRAHVMNEDQIQH